MLLPHRMDLGAAQHGAVLRNRTVAAVGESKIDFRDLSARRAFDHRARNGPDTIAEDAHRRDARMSPQLLSKTAGVVQQRTMLLRHPRIIAEHVDRTLPS